MSAVRTRFAAPFLLALATSSRAAEVVTRINGKEVLDSEVAEFALSDREQSDTAKAALEHLVEDALVEQESSRRGIHIEDQDLERRIREIDSEISASSSGKLQLPDQLKQQGVSLEQFRALMRRALACERMMAEDFGLRAGSKIPEEKHQVWFADMKLRSAIALEGLPAGTCAKVGDTTIARTRWAELYWRSLSGEDQRRQIDDYVDVQLVLEAARAEGLTANADEKQRELAELDAQLVQRLKGEGLKTDGVSYLQVLESRGREPAEYLESDRFLARIMIRKLSEANYGKNGFRAFYDQHRARFDERFGSRVQVSTIFLRAGAQKSTSVKRDYGEAQEVLAELKQRLEAAGTDRETQFARMARIWSEDVRSSAKGGEVGALSRSDLERLQLPVEAIDVAPTKMIGPHVAGNGVHLLLVTGRIEPRRFEDLDVEIRSEARRVLLEDLRKAARIVPVR